MSNLFISKITPPEVLEEPSFCFVYCHDQLLLIKDKIKKLIPSLNEVMIHIISPHEDSMIAQHYLGIWQNHHCYCVEIQLKDLTELPDKYILLSLRQAALEVLSHDYFHLAARSLQILHWDKNHQFCSRCGKLLIISQVDRAKVCGNCQLSFYPRISPCVIVLIKRGKEILLARSPHFRNNMYGLLAGFVEPGENIEHAVEREVMEEVGIKIKNLRYHFSQPWPFSDSLMLGFTADYAAGEIMIDGIEIEDAGWYTRDNLPPLPASISIGRKLIDLFLSGEF